MPQKAAFHLGPHCLHRNEGIYNFKEKFNHGNEHNGHGQIQRGTGRLGAGPPPGKSQVTIGFLSNSDTGRNYGC